MHKLEKIIAISKSIDSLNDEIIVDNFEINLQFGVNDGRLLETSTPDTIVIQLQHRDWRKNEMYYEVYISFRTLREVATEGEDLDIVIEINDGTDNFESTCMKWISNAKEMIAK